MAHSILAITSQLAQQGASFGYGFNDCEAMFPPKGKTPGDYLEVIRLPSETRPLTCNNHDNRILAG